MQPETQTLPWRFRATSGDRDFFTGRTGGREDETEARLWGFALPPAVGKLHVCAGSSEEIFSDSGLRIRKCVLTSSDLPSSHPPCEISEVLGTSYQHDSGPTRSLVVALRRNVSGSELTFCEERPSEFGPELTFGSLEGSLSSE